MKTNKYLAAPLALMAGAALPMAATADQSAPFAWELSVELGIDSVVEAEGPGGEFNDVYAVIEGAAEIALTSSIGLFGAFTWESITGPTTDREFDDMGAYVNELGLAFDLGGPQLRMGKFGPVFAVAWDETPGYYGTLFAEDYELAEMIGFALDTPVADAGTLSMALFYSDTTRLSDSLGFSRGRNRTSVGGAGNTGTLNNIAVQWNGTMGEDLAYHAGFRHLSAGTGDVSDENGLVLGMTYALAPDLSVLMEYATFDGFGGTNDDARYATLGASLARGDWTYSAAYTLRDITSTGEDHLFALGADYALNDRTEFNFGYAFADDGGVAQHSLGAAVVLSLGS